jgi:hypothetical protein
MRLEQKQRGPGVKPNKDVSDMSNNNNDNFVLKTNKQTNKQCRSQIGKCQTSRIYKGLFFNDNEEDMGLLERIEQLRRRDGWTFSDFIKTAVTEYVDRHFPGNPGLPLTHWTRNEPLSKAASEKIALSQSKSMPDYRSMSTEELLRLRRLPRTDYSDRIIIACELHNRGVRL